MQHQPKSNNRLRLLILLLILVLVGGAATFGMRSWQRRQEARLRSLPLAELESLAKKRPGDLEVSYSLGLQYAREGRYSDAVRHFLGVLEKEPTRADVLNDLGVVYLLQERYYESLVALQGALQLKPDFAAAYANMGRLHIATKMPFTAVKEFEKADKLEPNNAATLCDLGQAYQRTLNYKSALDAYERALRKERQSAQALIGAGQAQYAMTQYDKAEASLKEALQLTPNDGNALLALGRVQMERAANDADLTTVNATLEAAVRADQNEPEAWFMLGRLRTRQGRHKEALEMQRRALRIAPQHMGALFQLERCLRAVGRTADADRVAKTYETRKMHDRRELQLEEQISHNTNDWDARAELAQLYLESGKSALATLLCKRIQEEKPDHPKLPMLLQMLKKPETSPVPQTLLEGKMQ